MHSFAVVDVFYESLDIIIGVLKCFVFIQLYLLILESHEETLHIGVAVWFSLLAHA